LPLVRALVALRLDLLADLGFEDLIEDALQELGELMVTGKEALQRLLIQGNLAITVLMSRGSPAGMKKGTVGGEQRRAERSA
jgi:hypothetical protein